jgi:hypothetical protein
MPRALPEQHAAILAQKLAGGQLALFVGAGLSRQAIAKDGSGRRLPLWEELAKQVADACYDNLDTYSGGILDLFDAIALRQSRFTLEEAVRTALDDSAYEPSPAHRALAELPWAAVYTTNYDGLLGQVLKVDPVFEEDQYDRQQLSADKKRPRLFHVHGTLAKPHTLTREDYRLWSQKHPRAYRDLEQVVLNKTVLFVGYSLSDPHLADGILPMVHEITADRKKRLYAWMWKTSQNQVQLLDRRDNIEAISIEGDEDWANAFRELATALASEGARRVANSPTAIDLYAPTGSLPKSNLIRAYLQQVATQKPYVPWGDSAYIHREVTKDAHEISFTRYALPYDPHNRDRNLQPEPLEAALTRERRLVLLGEPGLGKTTSMLHLALETASSSLKTVGDCEVPVFVELKYYNGQESLEYLLADKINELLRPSSMMLGSDALESVRVVKAWMVSQRFLILLDGLNEVRPEFHLLVRGSVYSLLNSPHSIVVSCRERDYDSSLRERASAFILQGLQQKEIWDYLVRILGEQGRRIFKEQIATDHKMLTLAANPLMLWLVTVVAKYTDDARLLVNRGKLFREFIARMPRLRASEGIRIEVTPDVIEAALAKLGFEMQDRGRLAVQLGEVRTWQIPTADKLLEDVLTQAKDWRLLKSDGRQGEDVEFIHQLFLEYFAAVHLDGELKRNISCQEVLSERPFISRYEKGNWYEVIVMLVGISEQFAELIIYLSTLSEKRQDLALAFLAKRCLETSDASENVEARTAVVDALIAILPSTSEYEIGETTKALEEFADHRAVIPIIDRFRKSMAGGSNTHELGNLAHALGILGDTRAIDALCEALNNTAIDSGVRSWIVQALGRIWSNNKVTTKGEAHEQGRSD